MRTPLAACFVLALAACAGAADDEPLAARQARSYLDHDTPADLEPGPVTKNGVAGLPARFDPNRIMEDGFFTAADAVDAAHVQAFFERNPYGGRSFLADETVRGRPAATAIVEASRRHGINPIVMIARMQVEKSLVAKTARPSRHAVDFAFGCGCPDGRACSERWRGLDRQIECAASTLRRHFDASVAGDGIWNRGAPRQSLDPVTVTPATHATAALYAYTPWVLEGRGGNWLVWNVTRHYARHFATLGPVDLPAGGDDGAAPTPTAWIGDACGDDAACGYEGGVCAGLPGATLCSLPCAGYCPDRPGRATTFCVEASALGGAGGGLCTVQAEAANDWCRDVPGTVAVEMPRYVGASGVPARTAVVCIPARTAGAPPADGFGGCPDGIDAAGVCEGDVVVRCVDGDVRRTDCGRYGGTCEAGAGGAACVAPAERPDEPPDDPPPPPPACPPGVDAAGACEGDELVRFEGGQVARFDCAAVGTTCERTAHGAACVERPAPPPPDRRDASACPDGLDARGVCDGGRAVRCLGGAVTVTDCRLYGQACAVGPAGLAACRPTGLPLADDDPTCPRVPADGFCHGNTAVWCADGDSYAVDCDWFGATCAWGDDVDGWWCR